MSRNLSKASGERLGSHTLDVLIRQAYRIQVANYLYLLRSRKIRIADVAARFTQTGPGWEQFLEASTNGKGCVLVSAHYGHLEVLNHYLAQYEFQMTLPVERLKPDRLFNLICTLRACHGVNLVPQDAGLRPWLRAVARGDVVALFADWDPTGHGVPVQFFGAEARFPPGPAFLAIRSGAPLFVGMELAGDTPGTSRCFISAPLEWERAADIDGDVKRATQAIARTFERYIGEDPGRWVMFHDIWTGDVSQSQPVATLNQPDAPANTAHS